MTSILAWMQNIGNYRVGEMQLGVIVSRPCFLASRSNQIPEIANRADVRIPQIRRT